MKALIVEDNEDSRVLLDNVLENDGFTVRVAENGQTALELIDSGFVPDIIISDILMPEMDGYALCRALKQDSRYRAIPFIFYTATFTDPKDEKLALDLGADRFLVKPMDMGALTREIHALIQQRRQNENGTCMADANLIEQEYSDALARKLSKKIKDLEGEKEKLRQSESKYRRLVEALRDDYFFYTRTPDGAFSYISPSVSTVLGYSPDEFASRFRPPLSGQEPSGQSVTYERKIKHKNGQPHLLEFTENPVVDSEGQVVALEGIAHDLTTRKCLEDKLRQAQKMEAIGTLAGGIAHDFNNILSAIIGYAELIKLRAGVDEEIREHTETILLSCRRATALVRQILSFSRNSGQDRQPVSPHLIIREALNMLRATLPATVKISEEIDTECGPVLINPTALHQILINLCTNGLHALPEEKGELRIKLSRGRASGDKTGHGPDQDFAVLEISDNGCGMDEDTQKRIFDPYFTTKKKGEGTGLGLAVVHGIVHECGGKIMVTSAPGQGSTFTVFLPISQQAGQHSQQRKPLDEKNATQSGHANILVVDDEEILVRINVLRLEKQGYQVTGTRDPGQALELIRAQPNRFDLLLTDQTMPDMTGDELAQAAREVRPDLAIILCTGHQADGIKAKVREIGIDRCVLKPLHAHELLDVIRDVLGKRQHGRG